MKPLSEQEIREKIATILDRWGLNPDPDYGLPEELLQFILQDRQAWVEQAVLNYMLNLKRYYIDTELDSETILRAFRKDLLANIKNLQRNQGDSE